MECHRPFLFLDVHEQRDGLLHLDAVRVRGLQLHLVFARLARRPIQGIGDPLERIEVGDLIGDLHVLPGLAHVEAEVDAGQVSHDAVPAVHGTGQGHRLAHLGGDTVFLEPHAVDGIAWGGLVGLGHHRAFEEGLVLSEIDGLDVLHLARAGVAQRHERHGCAVVLAQILAVVLQGNVGVLGVGARLQIHGREGLPAVVARGVHGVHAVGQTSALLDEVGHRHTRHGDVGNERAPAAVGGAGQRHGELGLGHGLKFGFRERAGVLHAGEAHGVLLAAHGVEAEGLAVLLGDLGAPVVHDEHVVVVGDGLIQRDIDGRRRILGHTIDEAAEEAAGVDPGLLSFVAVDVRVAAQRRFIVEVVPQHQLVVALVAGGVHGMAAPAVAVGLLEDLAAVMGRVNEVAQVRAGERCVAAVARLAVLIGERLVVAHVGQDVVVAVLHVHDVPQILVARVASAVAGVQHVRGAEGVVEVAGGPVGEVGVHRRRSGLLRRLPVAARGRHGRGGLGCAPPQRERQRRHGRHHGYGHKQAGRALALLCFHPLLLPFR